MPIALRIKKVNLNVIPYSYAALFTSQTVDNLLKRYYWQDFELVLLSTVANETHA